jgi:hypothetical protein
MDVLSWRLRSHQLWFEGFSVMLGAPWGSKGRSAAAAPWLPPAIWQKTLNKVSNVGRGFIPTKYKKKVSELESFKLASNEHITTLASKLCAYGD